MNTQITNEIVNGHSFVDLGLPSGTLWADRNIGAESPWETGLYFAWGETTGYTAEQVKEGVRKFSKSSYKVKNVKANLTPEQDAAHANMGGKWRMPTKEDFQELIENCDSEWTEDYNGTGVAGELFTSTTNGNSVFFLAVGYCNGSSVRSVSSRGYCWSASWDTSDDAWYLSFNSWDIGTDSLGWYLGFSVRGVCG